MLPVYEESHITALTGIPEKVSSFFLKDFLGVDKTEFIEILHAITLRYNQHIYKVSKTVFL